MSIRDSFVLGWTPFQSRWNPSMFLFKCKKCEHEYLKCISPYSVKDVALRNSENGKKFWNSKFQCPKCKNYTPPVILILDTNPYSDKYMESLKPINIDDEKWKNISKTDKDKMVILDDYKKIKTKI